MKRLIIIFLILFPGSGSLLTAQTKVGTTAGNFVLINVSARSTAMGEAMISNTNDISGIYWNPALISYQSTNQLYFTNIKWIADIDINYGCAGLNLGNIGNVAAYFSVMNSGEIEITTEERPNGTGKNFTAQDMVMGLTYGRALTDRFNIGGTFKYIRSSIYNMSAQSICADVGLTYHTPFRPIVLGLSITNFGTEMKMNGTDLIGKWDPDERVKGNNDGIPVYRVTNSWDIPTTFHFGLTYHVVYTAAHSLLINTDVLYPNSNDNYMNVGAEYGLRNMYFLRAGYRQLFLDDAEGGLSFGGGLKYRNFFIDYAYQDSGILNDVQYISLGYNF